MPILDLLEGLSPWWWVAFAFALGALELATGTYLLIWISLAALQMAGTLWLFPGMSGELQLVLFAALSVGITFLGRFALQRYGDGGKVHDTLNQRSNHLVGRTGKVLEIETDRGSIEVDGMRWRARWDTPAAATPGSKVRVTAADGMELTVTDV